MLDTDSAEQLSVLFNQFSVPMFAAERRSAYGEFRIVCVNRAHADATGLEPEALRDVALRDLLPAGEADVVIDRYTTCADTRRGLRYLETLTLPQGVQRWDTSLQHVPLSSGGDRVIGTALQIDADVHAKAPEATYDDIRFFSALADMQLQNLVTLFDAARDRDVFDRCSDSHMTRLSGACRSAQRSVEDIRDALGRASADPQARLRVDAAGSPDQTGQMVRALFETAMDTGRDH